MKQQSQIVSPNLWLRITTMHWRFPRACSLHSLSQLMLATVLLCCTATAWASPVVLDQHHMSLNLSGQVLMLEDPADDLDLDAAKVALTDGRFQPVTEDHLQLGYSNSTYWFHFQIRNGLLEHTANNEEDRFYLTILPTAG